MLIWLSTGLLGQAGTWVEIMDMPGPRVGHAAALIENHVYVSGGRAGHGGMHGAEGQLWAFDIFTGTWNAELPQLPQPREEHTMVALGDTLLVFGGRNNETIFSDVLLWVVGSDMWQTISVMPVPRTGMGAFIQDGRVFLVGGKTSYNMWSPPTEYADSFDPSDQSWASVDPLNQARVDFAIVAHGDTALCLGGRFVDPITSVEMLTSDGEWSFDTPLQIARSSSAGVYLNGAVVVLGGITTHGLAQNNLIFNGIGWDDFEANLLPRYDLVAVATEENIYVMGGRNGNQILRSAEKYTRPVSIANPRSTPKQFTLLSAYPNPFNGAVTLSFIESVGLQDELRLTVYNIQGQLVHRRTIVKEELSSFRLNDTDLGSSGTYIVVLDYALVGGQPDRAITRVNLIH